ncbi:MAG: hypothetical protein CMB97_00390 [Flavobacteriaceae bacterium]|nr:hypothetical protein [Flavobacteriaceae bacterium]
MDLDFLLNPEKVKSFSGFLTIFLKLYSIKSVTLAKKIGVNSSYISKLKKGEKPSEKFVDNFHNYIVTNIPELADLPSDYLTTLAGYPPEERLLDIARQILQDSKKFQKLKHLTGDSQSDGIPPIIEVIVQHAQITKKIEATVFSLPFGDPEDKKFKFGCNLGTYEYNGDSVKVTFSFQDFEEKYFANIDGDTIRVQDRLPEGMKLNNQLDIPLSSLAIEIQPYLRPIEKSLNMQHPSPEKASEDFKNKKASSYPAEEFAHFISRTRFTKNSRKGLQMVDPVFYNKVRTVNWEEGVTTNQVRLALIHNPTGSAQSQELTVTVFQTDKIWHPPEKIENVFRVVKGVLNNSLDIEGIELFSFKLEPDIDWEGESTDLAVALGLFSSFIGHKLPEGVAAIGSFDGSFVKSTLNFEKKLGVLSDCKHIVVPESQYEQAQAFYSDLPVENRPKICPLSRFSLEELLSTQLFKEKLFFPTENEYSLKPQQVMESGFSLSTFGTIAGMHLPNYILHSDVKQGFTVDKLDFYYSGEETEWVEELVKMKQELLEKFIQNRKKQNPDFLWFDGYLTYLVRIVEVSYDGVNDIKAFEIYLDKMRCSEYFAHLEGLDEPVLQDDNGHACTPRKLHGKVGRNIENTPLVKQMTGVCQVLFMKNRKPESILIGVRADHLAGYPGTYTSATACCFPPTDTIKDMLEYPKKYGYNNEEEMQLMLKNQKVRIPPYENPHIAVSFLREIPQEAGIHVEFDNLIIRGCVYHLKDLDFAWAAEAHIDIINKDIPEYINTFRSEHSEFKELKLLPFTLEELVPLIVNKKWHPPALASLLMTMSAFINEREIKEAIQEQRIRKLWVNGEA